MCARFEVCRCAAHPRSRGEHFVFTEPKSGALGSSPLARGTFRIQRPRRLRHRLIPRSRGEHTDNLNGIIDKIGSSPLARGTSSAAYSLRGTTRLIPARAGNISRRYHHLPPSSAHPRSRGEHVFTLPGAAMGIGSSPLARGTYPQRTRTRPRKRLIPARAGNIFRDGEGRLNMAAHPRSRGEHLIFLPLALGLLGSSPLARGTFR